MSTVDPNQLYNQIKKDDDEEIAVSSDDVAVVSPVFKKNAGIPDAPEWQDAPPTPPPSTYKPPVGYVAPEEEEKDKRGTYEVFDDIYNEFTFVDNMPQDISGERGSFLIKEFQKSLNLPETGNFNDEATSLALTKWSEDKGYRQKKAIYDAAAKKEYEANPSSIEGIPKYKISGSKYWEGKNIENMTNAEIVVYKEFIAGLKANKKGTLNQKFRLDWNPEVQPIDVNNPVVMVGQIEPLGYDPNEFVREYKAIEKVWNPKTKEYDTKEVIKSHSYGSGSMKGFARQDGDNLSSWLAREETEYMTDWRDTELVSYSTGFNKSTDYSKGYHIMNLEDFSGNVHNVQIIPVPRGYGWVGGFNGEYTNEETGEGIITEKTHSRRTSKFITRRPEGYEEMSPALKDETNRQWETSIDDLNDLIKMFNSTDPEDQESRISLAKKINRYNVTKEGIWIPHEGTVDDWELKGGAKVSLWIDGKPFSGRAGEKGSVEIASVSPDGQEITFMSGTEENRYITHNIYDILNGEVGITDMEQFYLSSKVKLDNTFIYSPPANDRNSLDRHQEIMSDPVAVRSIETGQVSYEDLLAGTNTSIEKGVLNWVDPKDMSVIEEISKFDELQVNFFTDPAGRNILSLSRVKSAPDKVIAEFTDGTSMEVNTKKYIAWKKLKDRINSIRSIDEGIDMNDPRWVSPYALEKEMRDIQGEIQAFNVVYGDDNKVEVARLYRSLLDTYFDRKLDYVIPTPDQAYDMYYAFESWNPHMPPLSKEEFFTYNGWEDGVNPYNPDTVMGELLMQRGRVKTASDISTQARYLRNLVWYLEANQFTGEGIYAGNRVEEMESGYNSMLGWQLGQERFVSKEDAGFGHWTGDDSAIDGNYWYAAQFPAWSYDWSFKKDTSPLKTQLEAPAHSTATMASGVRSIIEEFKHHERKWTEQYGQRLLGDDEKKWTEVQAGGSLGVDEFFHLQDMIASMKDPLGLESIAIKAIHNPMGFMNELFHTATEEFVKEQIQKGNIDPETYDPHDYMVYDALSLMNDRFIKDVILDDESLQDFIKDMDDKGLMPYDFLAMDSETRSKFFTGLYSFLGKGENLMTLPNIAMMVAFKKAYTSAGKGTMTQSVMTAGATAVFAPMVAVETADTVQELIKEYSKSDEDFDSLHADQLWGELIFDGTMALPFAYIGGKAVYQRGNMAKNYGFRVAANPFVPYTSLKSFKQNLSQGGGFGAQGKTANPQSNLVNNLSKEGAPAAYTSISAQAEALMGVNSNHYLGTLLATKEGRNLYETIVNKGKVSRKDRKKLTKILKDKDPNALKNIEEGIAVWDELSGTLLQEFYWNKKFPNKDRYEWMQFLDSKFANILKTKKGQQLSPEDVVILRKHLGEQYNLKYKQVKENITANLRDLDLYPTGAGGKPTPTKKNRVDEDEMAEYLGNINLDKYPPDVQAAFRQLSRVIGKNINDELRFRTKGRGLFGTSWKKMDEEALDPKMIANVMNKILNTDHNNLSRLAVNDIEFLAMKYILVGQQRNLINNLGKFKSNGTYETQLNTLAHIWNANQAVIAQSGRKLGLNKHKISYNLQTKMQEVIASDAQARALFAELMKNQTSATNTMDVKAISMITELGRNMKLFSPASLMRSIFGNGVNSILHNVDKPLAATWDLLLTNIVERGIMQNLVRKPAAKIYSLAGKEVPTWAKVDPSRNRFFGETLAYNQGMARAYFGTNKIEGGGSVYNNVKQMLFENVDYLRTDAFYLRERFNAEGSIPGWYGKIIRTPQRAQAAIDILYRQPAEMGWLYQFAYRDLVKSGLKPGSQKFQDEFQKLINDPSDAFINKVKAKAEEITFQEKLGYLGQQANRFRTGEYSQMVQLWMPFFNTPVNILKQSYSRTPLGLFSFKSVDGFKKGVKTGHWGDMADVNARITTGAAVSYTAFQLAEGIWGDGNVQITGSYRELDKETREALEAANIKANSFVVKNEDGTYSSYSMLGWEPLNSIAKTYAHYYGYMGDGDGHSEKNLVDKTKNAMAAMFYEFTENPFLQGMGDLTDLQRGDKDVTSFFLSTARGVFMPQFMGQIGRINDPFYWERPDFSEHRGDLYEWWDDDANIFYAAFEREMYAGLSEGDKKSLLENVKRVAQEKREEGFKMWKEEFGNQYTDERLLESLDKIPDILLAKELFDDYTMNLPKLDYFGEPVQSVQGYGSIFGFNSFHQRDVSPYWTVSPKHKQIMQDKKFYSQAKTKIIEELIRLNVWDDLSSDKARVNGTPMSRIDKYLYNSVAGQAKLQFLMDNMIFDYVYDEFGDVKYENGRPMMQLNLDEDGNVHFAKRWTHNSNDELIEDDMSKMIKIKLLEENILPGLMEVTAHQVLKNYDVDMDWVFSPDRDFSHMLTRKEWDDKTFDQWVGGFHRKEHGKWDVMGDAEVMEAYNQWITYKKLVEDGALPEGSDYDYHQNYYKLLREWEEENNIIKEFNLEDIKP